MNRPRTNWTPEQRAYLLERHNAGKWPLWAVPNAEKRANSALRDEIQETVGTLGPPRAWKSIVEEKCRLVKEQRRPVERPRLEQRREPSFEESKARLRAYYAGAPLSSAAVEVVGFVRSGGGK